MNAPSIDIKDFLVDDSVGVYGTDLFIDDEPDIPNACVTVYDSGGFDSLVPRSIWTYEKPTVMIRIRGAKWDYETAYAKAEAVVLSLDGLNNQTKNSTRYIGIWMMGQINRIGRDDSERPIFTVNFRIHRTTTS